MHNKISRKEAVATGLPRYFTGLRCKRDHTSERFTNSGTCVECTRVGGRGSHEYARLKKREKNLQDRYGLTVDEFIAMVSKQLGRCAVCGTLPKRLVVDHCHSKQKVRDLLCTRCNTLLGTVDDSIDLLQLAIDYLVKHS